MSLTSHRSERSEVRVKVMVENFKVRMAEKSIKMRTQAIKLISERSK